MKSNPWVKTVQSSERGTRPSWRLGDAMIEDKGSGTAAIRAKDAPDRFVLFLRGKWGKAFPTLAAAKVAALGKKRNPKARRGKNLNATLPSHSVDGNPHAAEYRSIWEAANRNGRYAVSGGAPFVFFADGTYRVLKGWRHQSDGRYVLVDAQAAENEMLYDLHREFPPKGNPKKGNPAKAKWDARSPEGWYNVHPSAKGRVGGPYKTKAEAKRMVPWWKSRYGMDCEVYHHVHDAKRQKIDVSARYALPGDEGYSYKNPRKNGRTAKPKFKIGDRVCDLDGGRPGTVTFIGSYEEPYEAHVKGGVSYEAHPGWWKYKVQQDDGPNHYRNEPNLVRCKAKGKKRNPGNARSGLSVTARVDPPFPGVRWFITAPSGNVYRSTGGFYDSETETGHEAAVRAGWRAVEKGTYTKGTFVRGPR